MQSRPNPLRGSRGGYPLHEFSFVTIYLPCPYPLTVSSVLVTPGGRIRTHDVQDALSG